ncbi:MAG TPA: metal-dependent hydrolase [Syntrophobacteraceae bacterium]|nr:metal-dependent hydrolase [Syntrophobacteraceae bacterium]
MAKMVVRWLGHAFFQVTTASGKVVVIDPWIEGNPSCPVSLQDFGRVDIVAITHNHFDHVGQAAELIAKTGATLVAMVETTEALKAAGVPAERCLFGGIGMNIGGQVDLDGIRITMTQALHSSASGNPSGLVIELEDGATLYHAGDTGIFADMGLIGELYPLDVALLPIGDVFTMGIKQAAKAVSLLQPKVVIPMHYASFPILVADPAPFVAAVGRSRPQTRVVVLKPGEAFEIS